MAKYQDLANQIGERIRHGDYQLRGFPSHSGLVSELGVNPRTVKRALTSLVERGVLVRNKNGRFALPDRRCKAKNLGMLMPAWSSDVMTRWYRQIEHGCRSRGWSFRAVMYTHWHDPAITEGLRQLDGLFALPLGDDIPVALLEQFADARARTIVLEQDVSAHGVPCLRNDNPASVQMLINHLRQRGVARVHCLNAQPRNAVIRERIAAWRLWSAAHGVLGELQDEPVPLYEPQAPAARDLALDMLEHIVQPGEAILVTTGLAALGVLRAAIDRGRRPGHDLPVCAVEDSGGDASLFNPSLTCLVAPDVEPLLRVALDYIDGGDWVETQLLQPPAMALTIGESTGGPTDAHIFSKEN